MLGFPKAAHSKYEVIMDILSFKSLHEKWDGFDAIPLEVKSATNSIKLVDYIGEDVFCSITNYYPNPNGTITFEWENKENEIVSVEVGNDTFTYFVDVAATETKFYNNLPLDVEHTEVLSKYIVDYFHS